METWRREKEKGETLRTQSVPSECERTRRQGNERNLKTKSKNDKVSYFVDAKQLTAFINVPIEKFQIFRSCRCGRRNKKERRIQVMAQFQNATDAKQQSRRTSSLFKWTRTFENVTRHEKRGLNHRVFPISMSLKFFLSHRIQPDGQTVVPMKKARSSSMSNEEITSCGPQGDKSTNHHQNIPCAIARRGVFGQTNKTTTNQRVRMQF